MEVTLRLFAMQRQQVGARSMTLQLPSGATIADAWRALVAAHPVLAPSAASVRFARNAVYADPGDRLEEGDEVAVIPPVAGGGESDHRDRRHRRIELADEPFDNGLPARLRNELSTPADGAVLVFVGQTRESPGTPAPGQEAEAAALAGGSVEGLTYEAFEPMALGVLESIADEIEERFGVRRLAILHRTGDVSLGEASVVIAVAAPHRGAAFDACRYAIEELKARAPIWKSERFADGRVWVGAPARTGPNPEPARSGGDA
jgi:MoaE-MoaD fusion protein